MSLTISKQSFAYNKLSFKNTKTQRFFVYIYNGCLKNKKLNIKIHITLNIALL